MSLMRLPFTIAGEWISGLTVVALIIATTGGCDGTSIVLPGGNSGDGTTGLIINTDTSKDLIGGVRLESGEAVYAFGTFTEDGNVGEVTACVYESASGQQARLYFELGRLSRLVGLDGSELTITYDEVSVARLKGSATYTPADGSPPGTVNFDIDLLQTAAEVAQMIKDLTGIDISTEAPSDASEATAAKSLSPHIAAKSPFYTVLVTVFINLTGFTIHLGLSQILHAFVAVGNTAMIVFLTPFILMGNLMRATMGLPLVTIEYGADGTPNINIPRP